MSYDIHMISSPVCDAWVAGVQDPDIEYCYGGTRMVQWSASDAVRLRRWDDAGFVPPSRLDALSIRRSYFSGAISDATPLPASR